MKKMIMLDLDGTLLNRQGQLSEYTIESIKKMKDDYTFVIATGRPYHACINFYHQLELDTPLISDNGGYITNPSDQSFPTLKTRIDLAASKKLFRFAKPYIQSAFFNEENTVYTYKYLPRLHEIFHNNDNNFTKVEIPFDDLDIAPSGIIYLIDVNYMEKFENFLKTELKGKLSYRMWGNDYQHAVYEIYVNDVSKYTAISYLLKTLNISNENTVAFGDGINDLEMITNVHLGVAMINGRDDIKAVSDDITKYSNHEDGVVKYLEEKL